VLYRNDPNPLYYQLSERIKAQIESGEIKVGDKLPSESEMVESYGIGRLTVRNALSRLVNAGYLRKIHGKGTFCIASSLAAKKLNIDVILDMAYTYFVPYYIKGTSKVLTEHNCNFIISDSRDDSVRICEILEEILQKGSSGIIVEPSHRCGTVSDRLREAFRRLRAAGIPYIMIDSRYEGIETSYTMLDEQKGGSLAAQYFHELGHTNMAVVYMDQYKDSLLRQQGFTEKCAALGLEKPLLIPCGPDLEAHLVKKVYGSQISALFCYNDEVALESMHYIKKAGIRIPDEISIIGFDDTVLASAVEPSLTSIAHPKQVLGEMAARALLDLIHQKRPWPYINIFEPQLVKRNSCGKKTDKQRLFSKLKF
jgi:GntR family transcriptional regulator of arabinose operon